MKNKNYQKCFFVSKFLRRQGSQKTGLEQLKTNVSSSTRRCKLKMLLDLATFSRVFFLKTPKLKNFVHESCHSSSFVCSLLLLVETVETHTVPSKK